MRLRSLRACAPLLVALATIACFTTSSFAGFLLSSDNRSISGDVTAEEGGTANDNDFRTATFGADWSDSFMVNATQGASTADASLAQSSTIGTYAFTGTGSSELAVDAVTGNSTASADNNMLLQFGVDQSYDFELSTFLDSYGDGVQVLFIMLQEDATTLYSTSSSGVGGTTGTFTTGHTYTLQVASSLYSSAGGEKVGDTGADWDVTLTIPEPATCGLLLLVCGLIRRR